MTSDEFLKHFAALYDGTDWPEGARMLKAIERVRGGESVEAVRAAVRTTKAHLTKILNSPDPVAKVLGCDPQTISDEAKAKAQQTLGSLLVGRSAEIVFEEAYRREVGSNELELRDLRESRSDTDFRLYNGSGRPHYRLNIKFHGSRFRRAAELVYLDPEDCFALATYKIFNALRKQEEEGLPYIFAIVGVSGLRAEDVGARFPQSNIELLAAVRESQVPGKYDIEEAIVEGAVRSKFPVFEDTLKQIAAADWYVLSARKADNLLHKRLFERVFALRVRGFAQNFRGAELDMHFSLEKDLTPLSEYFRMVRENGHVKVATLLERGEI